MTPAPQADGAQAVRRALAVLRLVATGQEAGVRLTDIAEMSGLPRPTTRRLLKALVDERAIEQDLGTRRYRIGPELLLLGLARSSGFPVRAIAEPYLHVLSQRVGDTAFLSLRHGADSVCIGRYLGSHTIQVLSIDIGARRPLGASVSGIVLLAGLEPDAARAQCQANAGRLGREGRAVPALLKQVRLAREQGYTYAVEGVMPGSSAVAVPVRDAHGEVLAAISIAALADRLPRKRLPAVLAQMQEQARLITLRHAEIERAQALKSVRTVR